MTRSYLKTASFPSIVMALLLLCLVPSVLALPGDKDQPIDIEADSVSIDDAKGESIYRGKVVVTQGSTRLVADEVRVSQKGRKAQHITALGKPAHFTQQTSEQSRVDAEALRIEYDVTSEELQLLEKAVLIQGKDRFTSDRIIYDRKRAVVRAGAAAQGKQRVRVTIDPASK